MSTVIAVVALGWRQFARDRMALFATFLLPVVVGVLMVGIYESEDPTIRPLDVGVITEDGRATEAPTSGGGDAVSQHIVGRLNESSLVDVHGYDSRDSLERAIRRREIEAGVVIPTGAISSTVELVGPPTVAAPGGVRAVVESAVAETAAALHVGEAIQGSAGAGHGGLIESRLGLGTAELATAPRAAEDSAGSSRFQLQGSKASALQATLVLFVFTNTMVAGAMVTELRQSGILARALTSQATPRGLATGVAAMLASYALFQALLVKASGAVLFGVQWFSPGPTLLALGLMALAAGGLGLVFGTLLPTSELSATIGGPLGFFLAMVGGAVWPLSIVGPVLRTVGHSMPHAWAIDALHDAGVNGYGLVDIAPALAVLGGAAAALVAVGNLRLRRLASLP